MTQSVLRASVRLFTGALAATLVVGLPSVLPTERPRPAPEYAEVATPVLKRPGGGVARDWAPLFMSADHRYSRAEALELARRYDLIVAIPSGIRQHTAAMRKENPNLNLLAYSNGILATPAQAQGLPESAFSHDTSGGRVVAPGFGTFLMNPSNVQWRARANEMCRDRVASGRFDGCLVDVLTLGIFAKNFVSSVPVNPNTGMKFTEAEYRGEIIALASDLRQRSSDLVQVGNMVENSFRYWRAPVSSRPIVASAPAAQMEDFLRGSFDSVSDYPTLEGWRDDVRVITDMEAQGKTGLFTTKLWSGHDAAQAAQWQAYAMATYMMGANGNSFFGFTQSRNKAGASGMNKRYRMPALGAASGAMYRQSGGAFVRTYERGVAVVNPTGRAVRVKVKGSARRLDRSTVSRSFVLPARSGDVLRSIEDAPASLKVSQVRASTKLRPGRVHRIPVRIRNVGGTRAPRGRVRVSGKAIKPSTKRVRALRPGRSTTVRVAVRARQARPARSSIRFLYRAGGTQDAARMKVTLVRRR